MARCLSKDFKLLYDGVFPLFDRCPLLEEKEISCLSNRYRTFLLEGICRTHSGTENIPIRNDLSVYCRNKFSGKAFLQKHVLKDAQTGLALARALFFYPVFSF